MTPITDLELPEVKQHFESVMIDYFQDNRLKTGRRRLNSIESSSNLF